MASFNVPLMARRARNSPALESKIRHMALELAPLVRIDTGKVHPAFPATLLHFWLLTDDQLEGMAHFYHQRTPSCWSRHYPCPVAWPAGLQLEEKRRKIGKFIGLRGCETPVVQKQMPTTTTWLDQPLFGPRPAGEEEMEIDDDFFSEYEEQKPAKTSIETVKAILASTRDTPTTVPSQASLRPLARSRNARVRSRSSSPTRARQQQQQQQRQQQQPSSTHRQLPTVEEIIESARRAQLADGGEEAMRRKLGFY